MLLVQLCLISSIVFADLTESKVYLLRDYEDSPNYINKEKGLLSRSPALISKHKILGNSRHFKSKRGKHARQAVIHYGRHIYHLDSFEDLTKLRSPKSPDYISNDYFDINDLISTKPTLRDIPWDYVDDILYLSHKPTKKKCKGKKCEENLRKYSKMYHKHRKHKAADDDDDRQKNHHERRLRLGTLTRFQIIDNTKPKKTYAQRYESSEERSHVRRRPKPKHKKRKTHKYASSSEEEQKKNLASESAEISEKKKKKIYDSSEEASIYKKKKYSSESNSRSQEKSLVADSSSNSIEKSLQKIKKKKQIKTSAEKSSSNEEMYLQGNKLITAADNEEGNDNNDKRRRLPQFMPKRYHWDPDDIHDLGYYWFNGPKGKYSEPKSLSF